MQQLSKALHDAITCSYYNFIQNIHLRSGKTLYPICFCPNYVVNFGGESPLIDKDIRVIEEEISGDHHGVNRVLELLPQIASIVSWVLMNGRESMLIRCTKGDKSSSVLSAALALLGGVPFEAAYFYLFNGLGLPQSKEYPFAVALREAFEPKRQLMCLGQMYIERFSFNELYKLEGVIASVRSVIQLSQGKPATIIDNDTRKMHQIIQNIHLGNREEWLKVLNGAKMICFKTIITLCSKPQEYAEIEIPEMEGVRLLYTPVADLENGFDELMGSGYWDEIMGAIIHSLISGESLYIHCHEGISRSPSVLALALSLLIGLPYEEAYAFIGSIRPIYPFAKVYPEAYGKYAGTTTFAWRAKCYADRAQGRAQ